MIDIAAHGAVPDGATDAAAAIQAAIDAATAAGGGTVVVPAGQAFLTGSFRLRSRVTLRLEPGSRLIAHPDIARYHNRTDEGLFGSVDFGRFWIWADDAEDIAIEGTGTLDGNGQAFTAEKRAENTIARNPRAQSVALFGCRRVRIRDIAIRNSPSWALRPCGCDDVVIDGITIDSDTGMVNTDGIDPDCCKRVVIRGCVIRCGDDGICLKTRKEVVGRYGTCEDIVISDCIVQSSCAAIKIGTESYGDIRNVLIRGCVIRDSDRGIVIDGRDDAVIENVTVSDCIIHTRLSHPVWWHEGEPIMVCPIRRPGGGPPARVRNLRFRGLAIRAERGIYLQGSAERPPADLRFEDIHLEIAPSSGYPAGRFDPRPCDPDFAPSGSEGAIERTRWGSLWTHASPAVFADHLDGLALRDVRVSWGGTPDPASTHALEAWHVDRLVIDGLQGGAARPDLPAIVAHGPQPTVRP